MAASSSQCLLGGGIRGTLGDIDPLNTVLFKRAISRVKKGPLLRGLPNSTQGLVRSKGFSLLGLTV